MPARSLPLERSTSREGCHCSRWRLLISMRHSERAIASTLNNASEGNQTIDSSARMKCWPEVCSAALRCCPRGISAAFCTSARTDCSTGCRHTRMTTANVQEAASSEASQPHASMVRKAPGSRLRRRLSKIFQRARLLRPLAAKPPWGFGAHGRAQYRTCQSPRIQRCRRLASAL
ncbi:hypothetical protein D3C76_982440 [compost metagenome]